MLRSAADSCLTIIITVKRRYIWTRHIYNNFDRCSYNDNCTWLIENNGDRVDLNSPWGDGSWSGIATFSSSIKLILSNLKLNTVWVLPTDSIRMSYSPDKRSWNNNLPELHRCRFYKSHKNEHDAKYLCTRQCFQRFLPRNSLSLGWIFGLALQ